MPLTREVRQTVLERLKRDLAFQKALIDEAASLSAKGEPSIASALRDLIRSHESVAPRREN